MRRFVTICGMGIGLILSGCVTNGVHEESAEQAAMRQQSIQAMMNRQQSAQAGQTASPQQLPTIATA